MKKVVLLFMALFAVVQMAFAAININTATQEQLESLNGIGPTKAKAIIEYRNQNGRFKSLSELDQVKGIGEGTLNKIRTQVSFIGASDSALNASRKDDGRRRETREPFSYPRPPASEARPMRPMSSTSVMPQPVVTSPPTVRSAPPSVIPAMKPAWTDKPKVKLSEPKKSP